MRKKKEKQVPEVVKPISSIDTMFLMSEYQRQLEANPTYSLSVDPEDKYCMSDAQKTFIKAYVQYKNIDIAAKIAHLEIEAAIDLFDDYSSQQEIRRINRAMYARRFSQKMLSIDQIGGWLSSLLTDENVPIADRLKSSDKLRVAQMIIDLNNMQKEAIDVPSTIMAKDFETQLKDLSTETIRQMLNADNALVEKQKLIKQINTDGKLTMEDMSYLETLSCEELSEIIRTLDKYKKEGG